VIENEDGELVREELKDNDTSALHQSMKQVLTYLTHLDKTNTTDVLKSKLSKQVDGTQWSWQNLNSLCWAIGSISGTMGKHCWFLIEALLTSACPPDETEERTFLHGVLRELLGLAERRRDKDDKVVIASNIMYVVGQYPRFLNRHWGFLKVVSVKLFEFMHESHEGIEALKLHCRIECSLQLWYRCQGYGLRYLYENRPDMQATIRHHPSKGKGAFYVRNSEIFAHDHERFIPTAGMPSFPPFTMFGC